MDTVFARAAALQLVQDALLASPNSERIRKFIEDLPVLLGEEIPQDDTCPICLLPFLEILQEEASAGKEEEEEAGGITKLEECGHIFCRRDLVEWIRTDHYSCPTCRSQYIHIDQFQDDASSDGEYLPSSEGEEDIDVDPEALAAEAEAEAEDAYVDPEALAAAEEDAYNDPDPEALAAEAEDTYNPFAADWEEFQAEVESAPIIDPETEEREAMMEDAAAWMDDYDPEYDDAGIDDGPGDGDFNEVMEDGPLDPDFEPMTDDAVDTDFDPCLEVDPERDPFEPGLDELDPVVEYDESSAIFDAIVEDESLAMFDPGEDGSWDPPDLSPEELDDPTLDEDFDPGLVVDEASEDFADAPLEELDCEPELDSVGEMDYESDYVDAPESLRIYGPVESISDSEGEELEVELGLTDGESNSSSSEDEAPGPVLPTHSVAVQISVNGDNTGDVIIPHTFSPQPLK